MGQRWKAYYFPVQAQRTVSVASILTKLFYFFFQVNLVTKNKLLVDILVKAGHADKALSQIAEFVRFLLDMDVLDIDSKTTTELIRDQVNLWINTKEKIKAGVKNGVRVRYECFLVSPFTEAGVENLRSHEHRSQKKILPVVVSPEEVLFLVKNLYYNS